MVQISIGHLSEPLMNFSGSVRTVHRSRCRMSRQRGAEVLEQ